MMRAMSLVMLLALPACNSCKGDAKDAMQRKLPMKAPEESVVNVRTCLVVSWVSCAAAPAMAPPVESTTTPDTWLVTLCAFAVNEARKTDASGSAMWSNRLLQPLRHEDLSLTTPALGNMAEDAAEL